MKLRTQILLMLFLFGLTPLVAAMLINVPLVLSRLELFYHKAHLQNLRADFRDLDQHLASRYETVRMLAKFPVYDELFGPTRAGDASVQTRYVEWVNRLLQDQVDIVDVLFVDTEGRPRFWLSRDMHDQVLRLGGAEPKPPRQDFLEAGLKLKPGGVIAGPIRFDAKVGMRDPRRYMMLQLISPLADTAAARYSEGEPASLGAVVVGVDVGGLSRAYRSTYWVHDDGSYLRYSFEDPESGNAFEDFPGLQAIFAKGDLGLWTGKHGEQVIWVPLLITESSGPLWVGRRVDTAPILDLRHTVEVRMIAVIVGMVVVVLLAARWFASRAEYFRRELTDGIERMLTEDAPVEFRWQGPRELATLGSALTRLAETHARNSQALRHHARELEESNRYKSEFLANVSHELRTPLNSILLLSKLLADARDQLPEEQSQQARVIHAAGSDLKALIDDILDLSRIEAGRSVFQVSEIDLPALLEGLVELVQPQAQAKGLALRLEIEPSAPTGIQGDPDKVRQILKNFLSNAIKFTAKGHIAVCLEASRGEEAARRPVRITVRDTGIGIPESKHEVVFEAFQQADGSTSRRYGGTGLGLTISRELATLMGGRIEVHSAEGRGSAFSLLLPPSFQPPGGETAPRAEPEEPARDTTGMDLHGRRVLLVDDDLRNLLALTPLLEGWGLRVSAAGDGHEALDTLADEDVDLILMDIMMPEMDGYETIRRIRRQPRLASLPIVALSAKAGPEDRERGLAAGADAYLVKPVEPAELAGLLERYLHGAGGPKRVDTQ